MKLLIVTQVVDHTDTYLGFFHRWIEELAKEFEHIEVVCLLEGAHALPGNVRVHSLGKERGEPPPLVYALRFLSLAWKLRSSYDAVYVHMNEEYLLIAGLMWRVLRKPAALWRNHYAGSIKTRAAGMLAQKVFYTSTYSYTAQFANAVRMPVGVDTGLFERLAHAPRDQRSILFLARLSPSKRPEMLIDALGMLAKKGIDFSATIAGSPLPAHQPYAHALLEKVRDLGLSDQVRFVPGMPPSQTPEVFAAHAVFVNCAPSGMLDKTIFEAAASGCCVLAVSEDWQEFMAGHPVGFSSAEELSVRLETVLEGGVDGVTEAQQAIVRAHSLRTLAARIREEYVGE